MKLLAYRAGEEAHGSVEWVLVVDEWPVDPTREQVERYAAVLNSVLEDARYDRRFLDLQP